MLWLVLVYLNRSDKAHQGQEDLKTFVFHVINKKYLLLINNEFQIIASK